MLKVGDMVKVISTTNEAGYRDGRQIEYIPIGTICIVKDIEFNSNRKLCYGLLPAGERDTGIYYCYLENELEKGHLEWVRDE